MHSGLSTLALKPSWPSPVKVLLGLFCLAVLCWMPEALAHERWVLTPSQILEWNAKPKPELFTGFGPGTLMVIGLSVLAMMGLVHLHYSGANEMFPDLQTRLSALQAYASVTLRVGLAWVLISSAVGLEPRVSVPTFEQPTLLAPDLTLADLGPGWAWLRWYELLLGLGFLFGIYVRVLCFGLMLLIAFTWMLFQDAVFSYLPSYMGVAIYLLMRGPGHFFLPLPTARSFQGFVRTLEAQPVQRAQWFLRVLTGINILYLAVYFKVLQPNLALAVITLYQIPILSSAPEAFVMVMTVVEVLAGLLIMFGILLRFMSVVLLCAFFFFAACLTEAETFTSHILFYGIVLTFLFNGSGHWQRPEAKDIGAHIAIVGCGFAALHAARQLIDLRGGYSNISLTLIAPQPDFQFKPLLAEVVGGSIQPGNVVNPLRRLLPNTRVLCGHVLSIDEAQRHLVVQRPEGTRLKVVYSELIYAPEPVPDRARLPGIGAHALMLDSIGDALHLRQHLLQTLERAEHCRDPKQQQALLNMAIIGGGERGSALAMEVWRLAQAASSNYPMLHQQPLRLWIFEDPERDMAHVPERIHQRRAKLLEARDIHLVPLQALQQVEAQGVRLSQQRFLPCATVVNVSYCAPPQHFEVEAQQRFIPYDRHLAIADSPHHWAGTGSNRPRVDASHLVSRQSAQGRLAAYNAWAHSQGYGLKRFRASRKWLFEFHMGKDTISQFLGLPLPRFVSWIIQRLRCLGSLPGLERSLRIGIDWLLDGVFHNDIAVISPDTSQHPSARRLRLSAGQTLLKSGRGVDTVYLVQNGRLAVCEDRRALSHLASGGVVGEQEALQGRAARFDVVALTAVELLAFAPQQWRALSTPSGPQA